MKVIAWNMAHNVGSWQTLASMKPDIALLTEATPAPDSRRSVGEPRTLGRDAWKRPWSAQVWSKWPISPITEAHSHNAYGKPKSVPFETSRPGSWAAASVEVPKLGPVTVISVYGLLDEISDASVHRSLSELSPLFDDPKWNHRVFLGGDLNTGTQWRRSSPYLQRDRLVLERLETFGLVDLLAAARPAGRLENCPCSYGEECTHTRTRIDTRYPRKPYQTDYLFASESLVSSRQLMSCVADAAYRGTSDHFPVIARIPVPLR
jgi:endonuclease/exonuclease/phosphatase family metal-dependent hydrolase